MNCTNWHIRASPRDVCGPHIHIAGATAGEGGVGRLPAPVKGALWTNFLCDVIVC